MRSPSFCLTNGRLRGPTAFSTLGMRIQNEQSGSTSLFAQPLAIEAIPERQRSEIRDRKAREVRSREQRPAKATLRNQNLKHSNCTRPSRTSSPAEFSNPGSRPRSPTSPRRLARPLPPSARAISRCSSAGTTAPKQSAPAKSFFLTPKTTGPSKRSFAASAASPQNRLRLRQIRHPQ